MNNSQKLYLHIVIDLFPFQPSIVLCQNFLPDPAEENLPGYLRSTARANRRLVADVYPYPLKPETAMGRLNQQELEIQWVYMCTIYIYSPCLPGLVVAHGKHGKNRYQVVVMVILVGLVVMFWKLGITTNYRYMIYIYIIQCGPPQF